MGGFAQTSARKSIVITVKQGRHRRSGCTVLTGPLFLPAVSVSDPFYYTSLVLARPLYVHRYDLPCVSPDFTCYYM